MSTIKPTRMELLKIRKRLKLAEKGHKLLKEKRDALFNEFYREMKPAKEKRKEMESELGKAFASLAISKAQLGKTRVMESAFTSSRNDSLNIELSERNVMGAVIPILKHPETKRSLTERGYSITGTSSSLDESAELFESSLEMILELTEKESLLEKLLLEIGKTKRKVNSLEKVTIPRLEETEKYIRQRLEERERETFFTLKKVKAKKEAKESA